MFNLETASSQDIIARAKSVYDQLESLRRLIDNEDVSSPETRRRYDALKTTIAKEAHICRQTQRSLLSDVQRKYSKGIQAASAQLTQPASARYISSFPVCEARYNLGRLFFEHPEWNPRESCSCA